MVLYLVIFLLLPLDYPKYLTSGRSFYIGGIILFLMGLLVIGIETIDHLKKLKGLWQLFRASKNPSSPFSWQQFLRVSLPDWLITEIPVSYA